MSLPENDQNKPLGPVGVATEIVQVQQQAQQSSQQPQLAVLGGGEMRPDARFAPSARIADWLRDHAAETPLLLLDVDLVEANYRTLTTALPEVASYYAIKANPAPEVLQRLAALGAGFDVASIGEADLCLDLGIPADRLSYGNSIKKAADIAAAWDKGICLFAADSAPEIEKIAAVAPGAEVFIRLAVSNEGASWPLAGKFGARPEKAVGLLQYADDLGLKARGFSFHTGSQQTGMTAWASALQLCADLIRQARSVGLTPDLLNIGGGFPSPYTMQAPVLADYAGAVNSLLQDHIAPLGLSVMMEPGRALVADAALIETEVVGLTHDEREGGQRWLYLDIGIWSGLAEAMDGAIRFPLYTAYDDAVTAGEGDLVPTMVAGPTCDGADVLSAGRSYMLPAALKAGDRVWIGCAGAYVTAYATQNFNGFAPPRLIVV